MHAFYVCFTVVLILEKNEDIKTKSRTWEDISQCHKSFLSYWTLTTWKNIKGHWINFIFEAVDSWQSKIYWRKEKEKKVAQVRILGLCFLQRLVAPNIYIFDRIFWLEFIKVLLMYNAIMAITIFSSICWRSITQNSISKYYLGIFWVCRQYIHWKIVLG